MSQHQIRNSKYYNKKIFEKLSEKGCNFLF